MDNIDKDPWANFYSCPFRCTVEAKLNFDIVY